MEDFGRRFGVTAGILPVPLAIAAAVLFCAAEYDGDEEDDEFAFQEVEVEDLDESERLL